MGVSFFTTSYAIRDLSDLTKYKATYHSLDLYMNYIGFDDLRDKIEEITDDNDIEYTTGLRKYFEAMDTDDVLYYLDCLEILKTITQPTYQSLQKDPYYQTLKKALTAAVKNKANLFWG